MHVVHLLKLCILASLAATMLIGIMFMMRTGDENEMRAHAKRIVFDSKDRKIQEPRSNIHPKAEEKFVPVVTEKSPFSTTSVNIQQSTHTPSVQIFYYPWYGNPEFDGGRYYHWNHPMLKPNPDSKMKPANHTPPDDIAAVFYPRLGPYSSRNPAVIDQHCKWIASAGIDVLAVSWYPKDKADDQGYPWDSLIPALLNAAEKHKLKVSFQLEPYKGRTAQSVRDDIEYVVKNYGEHPAFYRTHRKSETETLLPLFYCYDCYRIPKDEWKTIATINGSATIRKTDIDSILLGLILKLNEVDDLKESGFDGVYTYFAADGFTEASAMDNWMKLSKLCTDYDLLFVPSIGPGYDDSPVRPWNRVNTKARENGSYYKQHFEAAHAAKADLLSITSFNEWHEGTQIEPAVKYTTRNDSSFSYQEYNDGSEQYLHLTHEMIHTYFVPHHVNIPMNIAKIV